jgi:hypothetical protein
MKTLKLIVPLVLLSAISAKANAFPDTLEKLFVENDFTTTQKKDIFPDKTDQEFGVNLGEGPYDSYSPVEPAPVGGLVVVYDDPSGNNDGVYSLDPVEPAPVGGLVVVYDDPSGNNDGVYSLDPVEPAPDKPLPPSVPDAPVEESYMDTPFNSVFLSPKEIGLVDEYNFGSCGDNFADTKAQSNYVAEYGDVMSEIEVYGYKNVLVTYFPEGTYGSEYDYADALGARLLTDIPVDGKETVTIKIAEEVNDYVRAYDDLTPYMLIQCSNKVVEKKITQEWNVLHDFAGGFLVVPQLLVVETEKLYFATFISTDEGMRLFNYQEIPANENGNKSAKFYKDYGLLVVPAYIDGDESSNYQMYGAAFKTKNGDDYKFHAAYY